MRKPICFLISLAILLFAGSSPGEIPDQEKLLSRKIEDDFYYVKGGKIKLKRAYWHFAAKERKRDTAVGEIVDVDYTCFCIFTLTNNSRTAYKVNPFITLVDYDHATLLKIPPVEYIADTKQGENFRKYYDKIRPFKFKILAPGETYVFEDEFEVSREVVLNTAKLKLEFAIKEVE
ncbi:MAG: hypothetical protein NG712_00990 [Omnitrophica bacterium]|nr:hypothetical protein [Candidatus Omnitrophota bacterium]